MCGVVCVCVFKRKTRAPRMSPELRVCCSVLTGRPVVVIGWTVRRVDGLGDSERASEANKLHLQENARRRLQVTLPVPSVWPSEPN